MPPLIYVSILLVVHLGSSLVQSQDCIPYYSVELDTTYPLGLLQTLANTVGACRLSCDAEIDCLGFDFSDVNECTLTTSADTTSSTSVSINHYFRQIACPYMRLSERCFFTYRGQYEDSASATTEFGPARGNLNLTECLTTQLAVETGGGGVRWSLNDSTCYFIFSDFTTPLDPSIGSQLYEFANCSVVPFSSVCTNSYVETQNQQAVGGSFLATNNTVEACQAACDASATCIGFDFDLRTNPPACFLHTDVTATLNSVANINHYVKNTECTANSTTCAYSFSGSFVPPSTIVSTPVPGIISLEECLGSCTTDSTTCFGISFDEELSFDCRIYTDSTAFDSPVVTTDGRIAYKIGVCPTTTTGPPVLPPGECAWRYTEEINMKANGAALINSGNDAAACLAICDGDLSCTGIDYRTDLLECWTHTNNPYPALVASVGSNEDHYNKYRLCGGCTYNYYPNQASAGGTIRSDLTTDQDCINGCNLDTTCLSLDFAASTTTCTLYTADQLGSLVSSSLVYHFVKTGCAGVISDCTFSYVAYTDRKIPGGTQQAINDASLCQSECTVDAACFSIDFNSANECYFITSYDTIRTEVGVTHYHLEPSCNSTSRAGCNFFAYGNKWPAVITGRTQFASSMQDCFTACIDATSCSGIGYVGGDCYTFTPDSSWADASLVFGPSGLQAYSFRGCDIETTLSTVAPESTTTFSSTTSGPGCVSEWIVTANTHAPGGLRQESIIDEEGCRTACVALSDCLAIDVDTIRRPLCYLHLDPNVVANTETLDGVMFEELVRCSSTLTPTGTTGSTTSLPETCIAEYQVIPAMKKPGGSQVPTANTLESCLTACEGALTCIGFDFNGDNQCYLHNNPNIRLSPPAAGEIVNHYVRKWNCAGCLYIPFINQNAPGGDPMFTYTSPEACILACVGHATCVEVDFNRDNPAAGCYFFYTSIAETGLDPQTGTDHWSQESCDEMSTTSPVTDTSTSPTDTSSTSTTTSATTMPTDPPTTCTSTYRIYQSQKVFGLVRAAGVDTVVGCMTECSSQTTCVGFDFNAVDLSCWIGRDIGAAIVSAVGESVDHYTKALECGDCSFEAFPGTASANTGSLQSYITVETCLGECSINTGCMAAQFDSSSRVCVFFSTVSMAPGGSTVTYYQRYDCLIVCEAVYELNANMKVPGGTRIDIVDQVGDCQLVCIDDYECQGFDFNNNDMSCWLTLERPPQPIISAADENVDHYNLVEIDCGDCDYTYTPNQGVVGQTGNVQADIFDRLICLELCSQDTTCQSADFVLSTVECIMYTNTFTSNLAANTDVDHFEKTDCIDPVSSTTASTTSLVPSSTTTTSNPVVTTTISIPSAGACTPQYDVLLNNKVVGGTQQLGVIDIPGCRAVCEADYQCVAFDFNNVANSCWLTIGVANSPVSSGAEDVDHYTLYWQCGTCRYSPLPDMNAPGGTLQSGTFTENACVTLCSTDILCKSVDFVNALCYLFNSQPTTSLDAGTRHWNEVDCSGTTTCIATYETITGQKVPGGTLVGDANTVDSCMATCNEIATCVGFDFNSMNSINQCWLQLDVDGVLESQNELEDVTHYSLTWLCNGCVFRPYTMKSSNAAGSVQSLSTTENDCVSACSLDITCIDASFNTVTLQCIFFTSDVVPPGGLFDNNAVNFWDQVSCPGGSTTSRITTTPTPTATTTTEIPATCVKDFIDSPNTNVQGGISQAISINTLALCQTACENDVDCIGFDFDSTAVPNCYLLGPETVDNGNNPNPGITNYRLVLVCGVCRYKPFPSKSVVTSNSATTVAGIDPCLFACNLDANCGNVNLVPVALNQYSCTLSQATTPTVITVATSTRYQRLDCGEVFSDNGGGSSSHPPESTTTTTISQTTAK